MAASRLRAIAAALLLATTARAEYVSKAPGTGVVLGGPLDFPSGYFKSEGTVYRFGNSAGRVPVLDSGAKLPLALVPDLPASIVTSGTFADIRIASAAAWNAKEPGIAAGTTAQYWRGDKTWQTLNAAAVGLGSVENTALSTWAGSSNLVTLGTVTTGTWHGSAIGDSYISSAATWNAKQNAITLGTTAQYFRGDLSLATLNIAAVSGLQAALDAKEGAITAGTASQYIRGDKGLGAFGQANGVSVSYSGGTTTIGLGAITPSSVAASGTVTGSNLSGTNTGDQTITLTGPVTGSGTGSIATTITNGAVTLAKMADMATASLIYRKTAGTGAPEVNSLATLKSDLGLTGTNSGDVTLSGQTYVTLSGQALTIGQVDLSGTHVTGTLAAARMPAHTGDVTSSAGSVALTIANVVTAGTATKITYNAKGQVTAGTTLAAGDIPSTLNATTFSGTITASGNVQLGDSKASSALLVGTFGHVVGRNSADGSLWIGGGQNTIELKNPTNVSGAFSASGAGSFASLSVTNTFAAGDFNIGVAASYSANVVLFGDSLHQQLGGIHSYFGTGSVPALGSYNGIAVSPSQGQNVAVAGTTVQYWRDNAGTLNAAYRREAGMNVAVALIGTNTLTTKTAKEVYSEIEALCRHLRETGWRVVLVGLLSRGGSNGNGTYDSQVGLVNAFIRQNWPQICDRFIDWGVINGGSNEFNTGGYSNTTYYTGDQLHQQVAGAQKLAGYEAAAINDLLTYYFQRQVGQLVTNINKATHTNVVAESSVILKNENPSAGQTDVMFAFWNGTSYVAKENIRGGAAGDLNFGAVGYMADYIGSTGPDVYGTNGSNGPALIFYRDANKVESSRPLRVSSNSASAGFGGSGLDFNYSSSLDYAIISSFNYTTPAWKPLLIQANNIKLATAGTDRLFLDASGNLGLHSTPPATGSTYRSFNLGPNAFMMANAAAGGSAEFHMAQNAYYDGASWRYISTGTASLMYQSGGNFLFYRTNSGSAGAGLSWTQISEINGSGFNLQPSFNYMASGNSVLRVSDNVNTIVNPVTNGGAAYLNWDRGSAGIGTVFGNGAGTMVARVLNSGAFTLSTGSGDPGAGRMYIDNSIAINAPSWSYSSYPLWVGQYASDRAIKFAGGYRTTGMRLTANNNADTVLVPLELLGTFIHINQGGLIVGDWTSPANPGDGNVKIGAASAKGGILYFGNDSTRYLNYVNLSGTEYYNFNDTPTVSAQAYLTRSSRTLKTNIKDWDGDVRTKRRRLHPRTFELKGAPGKERVGFVAEEVAEVLPEAASYVPAPGPDGVPVPGYDTTVIVAKHELELQEALDKIEDLEAAIASLQGKPAPKRRPDADKAPLPTPPPAPSAAPKPSPPPPATPAPTASPAVSVAPVETPRPAETVAPSPTPQATATAAAKPKTTPKRSPTPRR